MSRRRAFVIALGIYVPVMVVLTTLATLLLLGRGVDPVWAVLLGIMLASIANIVILLPIRIFVALRWGRPRDGGTASDRTTQ